MADPTRTMERTEAERTLGGAPRPTGEPDWLEALRTSAMAQFGEFGLPHRRIEDWKYTDVRANLSGRYGVPAGASDHPQLEARLADILGGLPAVTVLIVDGRYEGWGKGALAPPDGLEVLSFGEALANRPEVLRTRMEEAEPGAAGAVRALNTGLAREGAVVCVGKGAQIAPVIVLAHLSAPGGRPALHLRHLISLGAGASASVIEVFLGGGETDYAATLAADIHLEEGARLVHARLVLENAKCVHLASTKLAAARGAAYEAHGVVAGGSLVRLETDVQLAAPEARVRLGGTLLLDGARHADMTARIAHEAAHCESIQDFRAVLAGRSRGVVQAKVRVAPGAQHTDGQQLIRGLLLSDGAEFDAKPELEILADDVKCSHGATSGDLDEDALFYLRARGIPEQSARLLLIQAFLDAGLSGFAADEEVKALLGRVSAHWLAHHDIGGGHG